ncbi:DVUA0089 family protein [uncultured Maricaulis sp.]|uniref:DVUA0089 family protein n=1 Tax=uncultured Maricaulis sp. TaxID=174710 RepID=UPI0030DD082F|tara:strand:- start:106877 stop:109159 length:2283 start_codon:yes stop_codon:yes gene_type:complete
MRASIISLAMSAFLASGALAQMPANQVLNGELTEAAPAATFEFQLEAGQVVTLTTASLDRLDTILTLTGPDGQVVAENDDAEPGVLTSQLVQLPAASGRYTAEVTGYNGALGGFSLTLSYGIDAGLSDAAQILREDTLSFDASMTETRFYADLAEGDILVASTFALSEALDSTLTLLDTDGNILAQNDDRGDGSLNSQIIYLIPADGSYQLLVSTFGGSGVGDMAVSMAIDPEAELPFDFTAIDGTLIVTHTGELGDDQPSIMFPVTLEAGQTLLALADTVSGDLDPVLRLTGPDGFPVAMNDDRGDGSLNSAIAYTSPQSATYQLELSRYRSGASSGAFELVLSSVDASVVDLIQALMENSVTLSGPELLIQTPDFNVYYTLEGVDASSEDYARSVGEALEEVLETQVTRIGWAEPVRDDDGRYRAYVADAFGSMGVTRPVQIVFDNPNTSDVRESAAARTVFVIDNDFVGMGKTAPVHALMRATVTHEFNHVVQFGYDAEEALDWLYEATASWTETTTVGADQDATDYTETDFETPQLCWTTTVEGHDYGQWTLLQSMADSYGEGFIVQVWENSVTMDGFETLEHALNDVGSTIPDAIERWRVQNYARAYDLAPLFPIAVHTQHSFTQPGRWMLKGGLEQLGANYITVDMAGRYNIALGGDANLDVTALGQRNGQIEVIPLGRGGVVDTTGFESTALMVFNRAMPEAPGVCSGTGYSIEVTASTRRPARTAYRFSAEHLVPVERIDDGDASEAASQHP